MEKKESGELVMIDERSWTPEMLQLLNYTNYLTLDDREFEMVEGRLNINKGNLELLVIPVKK